MEVNTEVTEIYEFVELVEKARSQFENVNVPANQQNPEKEFKALYDNLLRHNYDLSLTAKYFDKKAEQAKSENENNFRAVILESGLKELEVLNNIYEKAKEKTIKLRVEHLDLKVMLVDTKNMKKRKPLYDDFFNNFFPMMMKDSEILEESIDFLNSKRNNAQDISEEQIAQQNDELQKLLNDVNELKNAEQEFNDVRKQIEETSSELIHAEAETAKMEEEVSSFDEQAFGLELLALEEKVKKFRDAKKSKDSKKVFKDPNDFPMLLDLLNTKKTNAAEKRKSKPSQYPPSKRSKNKTGSFSQGDHRGHSQKSGRSKNSKVKNLPLFINQSDDDKPLMDEADVLDQDLNGLLSQRFISSLSFDQENQNNSLRRVKSKRNFEEPENTQIPLDSIADQLQNESNQIPLSRTVSSHNLDKTLDECNDYDNSLRRVNAFRVENKPPKKIENKQQPMKPTTSRSLRSKSPRNFPEQTNQRKKAPENELRRSKSNKIKLPNKSENNQPSTGSAELLCLNEKPPNEPVVDQIFKAPAMEQDHSSISSNESIAFDRSVQSKTKQKKSPKKSGNRKKGKRGGKSPKDCNNDRQNEKINSDTEKRMIVEEIDVQQVVVENNVEMTEPSNSNSVGSNASTEGICGSNVMMEVDANPVDQMNPEDIDMVQDENNSNMEEDIFTSNQNNSIDDLFNKSFGELFASSPGGGSQPSNSSFEKFLDNSFNINDGQEDGENMNKSFDFFNFGGDNNKDDNFFSTSFGSNEGPADMF